jgi:hypothetical protein
MHCAADMPKKSNQKNKDDELYTLEIAFENCPNKVGPKPPVFGTVCDRWTSEDRASKVEAVAV